RTGPITLTGHDTPLEVRTGPISLTGHDTPLEVRTGPISLIGHKDEGVLPVTPPSIEAKPAASPPAGPDTVTELKLKSVRLMRVVPLAGGGDVNPFSVHDVETLISPRPLVLADGGGAGPVDPGTDPGNGSGSGSGSGGAVCLTPITRVIPANDAYSLVVDPTTGSCGFTQFPTFAVAQFSDCYGGLCVDGFAPWSIAPSGLLIAFNRVTFTIANGADRFTFTASVWGTDPMPDGSVIGSRTSGGERADGEYVDKALVIESFTRTGAQGAINTSTEGTINDTPITPLFGAGSR
ncbi:MAG: hypothetical protein PHS60_10125, partial [Zavarzinia sp.]|nr:hypothetical protein [Zavarzinia sp.]